MSARETLSIRLATLADIPAIIQIESASFGRDAWEQDQFLEYLTAPGTCIFLVAVAAATVAGYILGSCSQNRAEVDSIAVSPAHRGLGIATALMGRLMRLLRRRGFVTLKLTVRLDNAAAIALYRKLGFTRERRINQYYEDSAPAWRMRVSLN